MREFNGYPQHVAIIMDGNGRWAKERGVKRTDGHKEGIKSVDAIISASAEFGIQSLVLYAFSTENWKRPKTEVAVLMKYLSSYLDKELPRMQRENIRFDVVGRISDFDKALQEKIAKTVAETRENTRLRLVLALSYGGRAEIVDAVRGVARDLESGKISADAISEELFAKYLYAPDLPDPDLLIRTSGEMRISNFLLWQISYAELYVTQTLWPDFRKEQYREALEDYTQRTRRYGRSE